MWHSEQVGVGVSRCPTDTDTDNAGQPLRANLGYVPPRDSTEPYDQFIARLQDRATTRRRTLAR